MSRKTCFILIDGSNFYFKLKGLQLNKLLSFNFSKFAKKLAKDFSTIKAVYYVGKIRTDGTKRTQELFNNQRKLLAHLKKNSFRYELGYLLRTGGKYHEKGVDVQIAVDMLVASYEDLCDKIILVSSDSDLLPAIKKAKERGKIVEYIGFSHQPSIALVANCSQSTLLQKDDLEIFLDKKTKH